MKIKRKLETQIIKASNYVVYNGKEDSVLDTKMVNWADISSFTELIN